MFYAIVTCVGVSISIQMKFGHTISFNVFLYFYYFLHEIIKSLLQTFSLLSVSFMMQSPEWFHLTVVPHSGSFVEFLAFLMGLGPSVVRELVHSRQPYLTTVRIHMMARTNQQAHNQHACIWALLGLHFATLWLYWIRPSIRPSVSMLPNRSLSLVVVILSGT